jgi:hypothetical protein
VGRGGGGLGCSAVIAEVGCVVGVGIVEAWFDGFVMYFRA